MTYTLITKTGSIMSFFVMAAAEQFQQAYGGVIVTNSVLTDEVFLQESENNC